MKSSSGEHYIALDHVRALAALLVFTWHFTHSADGTPVPFEYVPKLFFFALPDEGHTGVALFMTLSGYLFAKLIDGKKIHYRWFLWNRLLRLAPLLLVVVCAVGVIEYLSGQSLIEYVKTVASGVVLPTLPNGGWSITVETHFYLILPLLLWLSRKSSALLIGVLLVSISLRALLHHLHGEVQWLAYWTLVGRIDQFTLGILAFRQRRFVSKNGALVVAAVLALLIFYWWFDRQGGFYQFVAYPSPSLVWIVLPTFEGLGYAAAIAYYDSFSPTRGPVSRFVGRLGAYSYSIYLLHFFVVFRLSAFIHNHVMKLSNFYVACAWAVLCFALMMPLGYLSFRFVEAPFLRLRRNYTVKAHDSSTA
jgi:peptidoglycan/LPS O-acetylase OafA/YrhL